MFELFQTFACEENSRIATNQPETNMAMAAKVEGTPEIVELLIESVRSQNVVWDSSCNSYKSKNALESAWVQILIDCGLEGKASHVKAKWHDLKDTY